MRMLSGINIYFAGTSGIESRELQWQELIRSRLLSYWDIQEDQFAVPFAYQLIKEKKNLCKEERLNNLLALLPFEVKSESYNTWEKKLRMIKESDFKVKLFLDSGAFSAWTQGAEINIEKYIEFIQENKDIIHIYANLDVIKVRNPDTTSKNKWIGPNRETAEKTLENQRIMEDAGLNPLPCFHYGEPFEYLKFYVENYDYIALGVAGNSGMALMPWLDECFEKYICDEKGFPKVKVHGFAVTSLKVMLRFPWFSVDSTTWVLTGRMGIVFCPMRKNGEWQYRIPPLKVAVSSRSPSKKEAGKHISTLPREEKNMVMDYLAEKGFELGQSEFRMERQDYILQENEIWSGKKPINKSEKRELEVIIKPGISNRYWLRDRANIQYFADLHTHMPFWPWSFNRTSQRMLKGMDE